jgi:hypothetical protein
MPSLEPVYPEKNIVLAHGGPMLGPIVGPITALLRDHPRAHNGTAHEKKLKSPVLESDDGDGDDAHGSEDHV